MRTSSCSKPFQPSVVFGVVLVALAGVLLAVSPAAAQNVADSFTPHLNASDLRELAGDGAGNLWIASNGGALRYGTGSGSWTSYPRLVGTGPRGNDLSTVAIDAAGNVWVGSADRGFTFYDPVRDTWDRDSEEWPDPRIRVIRALGGGVYIGTQNGLSLKPTPNRTDICADSDPGCIVPSFLVNDYALLGDTLWVGTQGGLGRFNGTTWDSASALPAGSVGQESVSITAFGGVLWEATPDSVRRLDRGIWEGFPVLAHRLKESDGLLYAVGTSRVHRWEGTTWLDLGVPIDPGIQIRDVEIVGGAMYLATNVGLFRWDWGPTVVQDVPPGPLLVGTYTGVVVDRNGIVWGGTSERFLGMVHFDGTSWGLIETGASGLLRQWIPELMNSLGNEVWVGHCCCPSPPSCPVQVLEAGAFSSVADVLNIRTLDQGANGLVWGGTKAFGVEVLEHSGGAWGRSFSLTSQSTGGALHSNDITSVVVTPLGTYMGTEADGFELWPHGGNVDFGRDGTGWIHVGQDLFGLLDDNVGAILEVGDDVWVGTSGGLHRFEGASLQERCPTRDRDLVGDPTRKVNALLVDRLGGLWIGTDTGLMYLPRGAACDAGGGDFTVFTDENSPLPHNRVLSAASSPVNGHLWFGTSVGLLEVDPLAFTGSAPPPDRFVLYPNPIDLRQQLGSGEGVRIGIEIAGSRVVPAGRDALTTPMVYDITGRLIGAFADEGSWLWDGKNLGGVDSVAPGIYFVRAETLSGEVVVLRLGVIR